MRLGSKVKITLSLIIFSFFLILSGPPISAQDYVNIVHEGDIGIIPTINESSLGIIGGYYNIPADYWGPSYGHYLSITFHEDDDEQYTDDPFNWFPMSLGYEDITEKASGTVYFYMPVVPGVYSTRAYQANANPNSNFSNLTNYGYTTNYDAYSDVILKNYSVVEGPATFANVPASVHSGEQLAVSVRSISSPVSWVGVFPIDAKTFEDCLCAQYSHGGSITYNFLPADIAPGQYCLKVVSYILGNIQVSTSQNFEVIDDEANALQLGNTVQSTTKPYNKDLGNLLVFTIGNSQMSSNGLKKDIDPGYGTAPLIKDGRTFIPIRALIEQMGGTIEWSGAESKITIQVNGKTIELWLGKNNIRVDGSGKTMDVVPFISSTGRTMLPLRFVTENLGCEISWDSVTQTATIRGYGIGDKPKVQNEAKIPAPVPALPKGVPSSLPAPTISNLELLTYDDGAPYFRAQVTVPASVLTLDQERPTGGWVNLETDGKIDVGEWGTTGGGGGYLDVVTEDENAVPGKTNTFYVAYDLEDEGGLTETVINTKKYTYRLRFDYTYYYGDGPGEWDEIYSPWSNELSGQSESYYRSDEE